LTPERGPVTIGVPLPPIPDPSSYTPLPIPPPIPLDIDVNPKDLMNDDVAFANDEVLFRVLVSGFGKVSDRMSDGRPGLGEGGATEVDPPRYSFVKYSVDADADADVVILSPPPPKKPLPLLVP